MMTDSRIRVSYGETVRTGEYESARLDLSVEKDCVGVADERQLRQALLKQLVQEVEDWKQQRIHGPTALPTPSSTALPTTVPTALPKPTPTVVPLASLDWHDARPTSTNMPSATKIPDTPKPSSQITTQPSKPELGSVASVTDQQIIEELDTLDWIDNKKGTGWFTPLEEIPFPIRAALIIRFNANITKSLRLGTHVYTRFGDDNGLIGKFSATKQEKVT